MGVENKPSRRGREYQLPGDDEVKEFLAHKEPLTSLVKLMAVGVLGLIIGAQAIGEKVGNLKALIKKSTPEVKVLLNCLLL